MPEASQTKPDSPVADAGGLRLRVVRAVEELDSIRGPWERMQRHPNADFEFYRAIHELRPSVLRPHVILLEDEAGRPRAMLVGRIEWSSLDCSVGYLKLWRPRVRMLTIVYGGVVGELTPPLAARLAGALLGALAAGEADVARVGGLDPASEFCRLLRRLPGALCRDRLAAPTPHWEITLPPTYDAYLARLKPKLRSELRRVERKFENEVEGAACRLFQREDEVAQLCADAEAVARLTYQRGIGAGFIDDAEHRRRLALAAARGWLRAWVIYAGGVPCAFEMGTLYQGTFFLDYTGYDPAWRRYEVGTLVFLKMIAELCRGGVATVDCGLGDAAYKHTFADRCHPELSVMIFAPKVRGVWINTARTATLGAARVGAATLKKLGIENKIKKLWRGMLRRKSE